MCLPLWSIAVMLAYTEYSEVSVPLMNKSVQSRVIELFFTEPAVPSAVPTSTCRRSNSPV